MRSEWRQWPDAVTRTWSVSEGTAHVVARMLSGEAVENGDGSRTPREFTYIEMPTKPELPYYVMECAYGDDLVPRVMALQAIQRAPEREVRSADLRRIRVEDALEQAWLHVTFQPAIVAPSGASPADLLPIRHDPDDRRRTYRGLRSQNRRKITDTTHAEVARVYAEGLVTGAPTRAVRQHFDIAESTASLYVKRARDAGALPPVRQPVRGKVRPQDAREQ